MLNISTSIFINDITEEMIVFLGRNSNKWLLNQELNIIYYILSHSQSQLLYKQCSYRFLSLPRLCKSNSISLIKYLLVYLTNFSRFYKRDQRGIPI